MPSQEVDTAVIRALAAQIAAKTAVLSEQTKAMLEILQDLWRTLYAIDGSGPLLSEIEAHLHLTALSLPLLSSVESFSARLEQQARQVRFDFQRIPAQRAVFSTPAFRGSEGWRTDRQGGEPSC